MKILILNGSPRKGNTVTAVGALVDGIGGNHEVEIVNTYDLQVGPCKGCDACQCSKGCVDRDDTNRIVDKIVAADMVVWATPVYWWGMTAQLKLVLDKCYCRGAHIKGKKTGLILVGGAAVDAKQYELIREQFACIEKSLGWDVCLFLKYSASGRSDLGRAEESLEELRKAGAEL